MKNKLLIVTLLLMLTTLNTYSQSNPEKQTLQANNITTKNGLSCKVILGFPSSNFLDFEGNDIEEPFSGITLGLQVGNRWYLYRKNKMGLALNVNWLDINIDLKTSSYNLYDKRGNITRSNYDKVNIDISFLEFGPMYTYTLNNMTAIDFYYNLCPRYISYDNEYSMLEGFTFSNTIGLNFRYKIFSIGLEANVGKINVNQQYTQAFILENNTVIDLERDTTTTTKVKANNFMPKFTFGVKF